MPRHPDRAVNEQSSAAESATLNRDATAGDSDTTAPQTSSSSESKPEAESLGSTRAALTGHQRRVMIECRFNAEYAASPGLTDIDLAYRLKLNHSHARGLRGQLVKLGLLRDSGTKRAGLTKIKATVWVLTEKGINA